jgi:aryl-phospho-beta-D-glucosidase BglC (GH1 family)
MKKIWFLIVILTVTSANIFPQDKMEIWVKGVSGVNIYENISLREMKVIRNKWKANAVRIICRGFPLFKITSPYSKIDSNWNKLDNIINEADSIGLYVILDPLEFPGYQKPNPSKSPQLIWEHFNYWKLIVNCWKEIVTHCKNYRNVIGYVLISEPRLPGKGTGNTPNNYNRLLDTLVLKIRKIDVQTPLIVNPPLLEGAPFSNPNYFSNIKFGDSKLILSFNFFDPFRYTNQGAPDFPIKYQYPGCFLPGSIDGKWKWVKWNYDELLKSVEPYHEYQKETNCIIYVGGFNASIYATGGENWLRDVLGIFHIWKWSWTFHSFRGSKMWDLERTDLSNLRLPLRLKILKGEMSTNQNYMIK